MKTIFFICIGVWIHVPLCGQSFGVRLKESSFQLKSLPKYYFLNYNSVRVISSAGYSKSSAFVSPYKYKNQLGFVCKWELKMDEKTKNPVRFRLGSYDYVNKLEGK